MIILYHLPSVFISADDLIKSLSDCMIISLS